jgi:hypothetical protein
VTDPSEKRRVLDPSDSWTPEVIELLRDWQARARRSSEEHYALATSLARSNIRFGIPVVALTTLVGTTVFASLQRSDVTTGFRIAVGMISVLAAVLASLQTFLRFGERAEKHRAAAERWASIRREIDTQLALSTRPNLAALGDSQPVLDRIRDRMDQTAQQSPELGETGWLRPQRRYPSPAEDAEPTEPAHTT